MVNLTQPNSVSTALSNLTAKLQGSPLAAEPDLLAWVVLAEKYQDLREGLFPPVAIPALRELQAAIDDWTGELARRIYAERSKF